MHPVGFVARHNGVKLCSHIIKNDTSPLFALEFIGCDIIQHENNKNGKYSTIGHLTDKNCELEITILSNYDTLETITIKAHRNGDDVETIKFENKNFNNPITDDTQWRFAA